MTANQFSELFTNDKMMLLLVLPSKCLKYTADFNFRSTTTQTGGVSGWDGSMLGTENQVGPGGHSSPKHIGLIICIQSSFGNKFMVSLR